MRPSCAPPKLWVWVWVWCALAVPAAAQVNYAPYPIGERASGLGGAYTGLANDEAGTYYNPAGPAFSRGNSLSVSTSFYGLVFGRSRDALGQGADFQYSTLNLVPTTAGSLWRIGGTEDEQGKLALLFNVFSPSTFELDQRSDVNSGGTTLFQTLRDETILLGPGAAYRVNEQFGVGVTLHGALNTYTQRLDLTVIRPVTGQPANDFRQFTLSREQTNVGLLATVGARYQLTEELFVGAALRSPTIHLYGRGQEYGRFLYSQQIPSTGALGPLADALSGTFDVDTQRILPLRASLGAAFVKERKWTFTLDVTAFAPVSYLEVSSKVDPNLNQTADYRAVINAAAGFEYFLTRDYPVRVGLFTDRSPVRDPSLEPGASTEDRINLYGATVSVSSVTRNTSTSAGLVASVGQQKLVGIDLAKDTSNLFLTTGTQWRVYFILSSSYSY